MRARQPRGHPPSVYSIGRGRARGDGVAERGMAVGAAEVPWFGDGDTPAALMQTGGEFMRVRGRLDPAGSAVHAERNESASQPDADIIALNVSDGGVSSHGGLLRMGDEAVCTSSPAGACR